MMLVFAAWSVLLFASCHSRPAIHRENGWYRILGGQEDSIALQPIVTVKEFVDLRLETDPYGKSAIIGRVSKHKLQDWADSTERAIGQCIGFLFNDSVISAPQVNMRIESGTFSITTVQEYDMESLYHRLIEEKRDSLDALFRVNGWEKDSVSFNSLEREKQDSIINSLDYMDACAITKGFE